MLENIRIHHKGVGGGGGGGSQRQRSMSAVKCFPSKHIKVGHQLPTSETPFGWRFIGGSLVARSILCWHVSFKRHN